VANQGRPQAGGQARPSYRPSSLSQASAPRKRVILTGAPPLSTVMIRGAGLLLLVATGLAVGGLFPKYTLDAAPSTSSTSAVLLHVVPAGAWFLGGVAVLSLRPAAIRAGNALAAGASLVTFGITIVEISQLIGSKESLGAGFYMELASGLVALLAALIGSLVLRRSTTERGLAWPRLWTLVPAVIAGAGFVVADTQSWQHEKIVEATKHQSASINVPAQFDARWEVIAGQIVIVVALVAFTVLASQWRRRRAGGAFIAGAVVGFASYALPTYVTNEHPLSRFSAAVLKELKQEKITFSIHFLWWYWAAVGAAAVIAVVGLALLMSARGESAELNLRR
jgi:hypothetical protein